MAAAAILGRYNYTYGAGSTENRQIQFSRTDAGAIQARVYVLQAGGVVGALTSTVPGNKISVEMECTSRKAAELLMGWESRPSLILSKMTPAQQNALMGSLASRKIEGTNGHGVPGGYEVVQSLNIFDPH